MAEPAVGAWTVVVPQKDLRLAKSRIDLDAANRRRLVICMLADTVAAVQAVVDRVVVVCDSDTDSRRLPLRGVTFRVDARGRGLNAAVAHAAARAGRPSGAGGVAVVPGDLPGLRPADLARALHLATQWTRSFVADAARVGTTFLAATGGHDLRAEFGPASRLAHRRSGAVELGGPHELTSLRQDVDDLEALDAMLRRGCGALTREFGSALHRT